MRASAEADLRSREGAREPDPYAGLLSRLASSRAVLGAWRKAFARGAGRRGGALSDSFSQNRGLGFVHAPRLAGGDFERALQGNGGPARRLLEMFEGSARGDLRIYQPRALGFSMLASPTRLARHGPVSSSLPQLVYPGVNG